MFRFLHTSDLHLGKRFGNFDGDLPGRLREARHQIITKLARLAYEHDVDTILIAGDSFDSETPAADVRRQAITEMAAHPQIKWLLLPGNHDSLQAVPLWDALQREVADNIILAVKPQPIELTPCVTLLPAPCPTRRVGRDVTQWMDLCPTSEGVIRIGLAHGAVRHFCENGDGGNDIIAPDRARRARLDYLALGDWHGAVEIDPRSHYCGTPEPDRFKHLEPATVHLVTIAAAGSVPQIQKIPIASFCWLTINLALAETDAPVRRLQELLPAPLARRQTLVRIIAHGYSHLEQRSHLVREVEVLRPDFAFLEFDESNLSLLCGEQDLDRIDEAGALRTAADELLAELEDETLVQQTRTIAASALARLYHYAQQYTQERVP